MSFNIVKSEDLIKEMKEVDSFIAKGIEDLDKNIENMKKFSSEQLKKAYEYKVGAICDALIQMCETMIYTREAFVEAVKLYEEEMGEEDTATEVYEIGVAKQVKAYAQTVAGKYRGKFPTQEDVEELAESIYQFDSESSQIIKNIYEYSNKDIEALSTEQFIAQKHEKRKDAISFIDLCNSKKAELLKEIQEYEAPWFDKDDVAVYVEEAKQHFALADMCICYTYGLLNMQDQKLKEYFMAAAEEKGDN